MSDWYVKKSGDGGAIAGPLSGSDLKQLATLNCLSPDDLLARDSARNKWVAAAKIRNLVSNPQAHQSEGSPVEPSPKVLECRCGAPVQVSAHFAGLPVSCAKCGALVQERSPGEPQPISAPRLAKERNNWFVFWGLLAAAVSAPMTLRYLYVIKPRLAATAEDFEEKPALEAAAVETQPVVTAPAEDNSASNPTPSNAEDHVAAIEQSEAEILPVSPSPPPVAESLSQHQSNEPIATLDLSYELEKAGYDIDRLRSGDWYDWQLSLDVRSFFVYGPKRAAELAMSGNQFDRRDAVEAHSALKKRLETQSLAFTNLKIRVPARDDFDTKGGLLVSASVGMQLKWESSPGVMLNRSLEQYWALAKDGMRLIKIERPSDMAAAKELNAPIYVKEHSHTEIAIRVPLSRETARHVTEHPEQYGITIIFDRFSDSPPASWGFYLSDRLREHDGDCDAMEAWNTTGFVVGRPPWYFRVDPEKMGIYSILQGRLQAVYFHTRSGEVLWECFGRYWQNGVPQSYNASRFVNPVPKQLPLSRVFPAGVRFSGKWNVDKYSGRIGLKVIETNEQDGNVTFQLYDPATPTLTKSLKGTLAPKADGVDLVIDLAADPKTGIKRAPSRGPATSNLLLLGDSRKIRLSLSGEKLTGKDSVGVEFDLHLSDQ